MYKRCLMILLSAILSISMMTGCSTKDISGTTPGENPSDNAKEPITIIMGSMGNPDTKTGQAGVYFAQQIEERSNGEIIIDLHDRSTLGYDAELIQQAVDGTLPCVLISMSIIGRYCPLIDVIQLPFLITSYEQERKAFQSDEFKAIADKVSEVAGIKIVGIGENGLRHFANNVRPINSVKDLANMKIRIAESEMLSKAMKALGANPVPLPYGEVYTALQNKIVDGEEINIMSVRNQKHYEVVKYMSLIGMYPFASAYVFNLDFWNSLSEEHQKVILDSARATEELLFTELLPAEEKIGREIAEDGGMIFNEIQDVDEFKEAMIPLYEEYRQKDPLISDFIDMALKLK